ncbi:MAG: hypothetical protein ACLFTQ_01760 [Candidatus Aenigmatarchaeota archaeon]
MDFARVLLVAIVLFGVLLVLFGGEMDFIEDGEEEGPLIPGPSDGDEEEGEEEPGEAFYVGRIEDTAFKHVTLSNEPFKVSFHEEERTLGKLEDVDVRRGIGTSETRSVAFNLTQSELDNIVSFGLDFWVKDTNRMNELELFLNGGEVYSGYPAPERSYTVDVNRTLLDKTNELEISPKSSGWRFWAPTVYILENFTMKADILGRNERSFEFSLTEDQADNFRMGRLVFMPDEFVDESPLVVQVNGKDVYRDIPEYRAERSMWIDFEEAEVEEGQNELTLFTEVDSSYSFDSAKMVYFWNAGYSEASRKVLDVSSGNYNQLPGNITFQIDRIEGNPRFLTLKIETAEGEEKDILAGKPLKEGETISIEITKDDLAVGENTLQFEVGGEGGFYLSDFEVTY